ncbi:hypothetical protein EBME_2085 [bacterium endosymbiont of Mortierella elongata FMR23-6]|nr:hypothetical protein EBME_2085 [bacterium endosymbiont of Mortierella elongata FMR23-6]
MVPFLYPDEYSPLFSYWFTQSLFAPGWPVFYPSVHAHSIA